MAVVFVVIGIIVVSLDRAGPAPSLPFPLGDYTSHNGKPVDCCTSQRRHGQRTRTEVD